MKILQNASLRLIILGGEGGEGRGGGWQDNWENEKNAISVTNLLINIYRSVECIVPDAPIVLIWPAKKDNQKHKFLAYPRLFNAQNRHNAMEQYSVGAPATVTTKRHKVLRVAYNSLPSKHFLAWRQVNQEQKVKAMTKCCIPLGIFWTLSASK